LFPTYTVCHTNLGRVYEALGRDAQAIAAYKRAIYYTSGYPPAHLYLGKLYLKLGRVKEAKKLLKRTIEIDPHGPEADEAVKALQAIK
jgi:tetratricopeptide (TPR) repeat protein